MRLLQVCAVLIMSAACAKASVANLKPNLIFIMADDQGWNNVGFHNDRLIAPHTNALVDEGLRLNWSVYIIIHNI